MKKIIMPAVVAGTLLMAACSANKPNISDDQCADIIFEMHKADAIISVKGFNDKDLNNDSLSYYNDVFVKMGISRQEFIETIEWYVNHPDQYKDLYTKVINKVAKYEEDETIRYNVTAQKDSNDVWNQKTDWHLPLDGETNPIAFDIPVDKHGTYTLVCDVTYYEDDKTENPRTTLIAEYDDGTDDSNMVLGVVKDGKQREVKVMVNTNKSKKLKRLHGWVLDHSDGTESKHIDCYNIRIKHSDN